MARRQKYYLSHLNITREQRGKTPQYEPMPSAHRGFDAPDLTPSLTAIQVQNCHTIQRLQSALWLRRQQNRLSVKGKPMSNYSTPLYVIQALAAVREGGEVNMLDRRGVKALCSDERAAAWIDKSSATEYMDALNDMGQYVSDDAPEIPVITEDTDYYDDSQNYSY